MQIWKYKMMIYLEIIKYNNMNEYDNIIATLDRIIAMQDRMIEKLDEINNMVENNNNISSETSMVERWDTTGPR